MRTFTGKQDPDETSLSQEDLQKQLGDWERRLQVMTRIYAASAIVFLIGIGASLWLFFNDPAKSAEAIAGAIGSALIGTFNGILAFSTRRQRRAIRACKNGLKAQGEQQDQT